MLFSMAETKTIYFLLKNLIFINFYSFMYRHFIFLLKNKLSIDFRWALLCKLIL